GGPDGPTPARRCLRRRRHRWCGSLHRLGGLPAVPNQTVGSVMDGGFWTLPWSTLGPGGILAIFVLLIGLGWLVPRFYYQQKSLEADRWREVYERSERVRERALKQVEVLTQAVDKLADQKDLGASLL